MREGWTYKKLGECFPYIKNGANIKQIKDAKGYPITRIETLSGGVFNRDRMGYADIFDINKFQDYLIEDGDLLMSHINSKTYIGRTVKYISKNNEKIIHGMNLLRLKSNESLILSSFFKFYTDSWHFKTDIARIRKDAVNQSSFAISDLKNFRIPLPSLSEQQSIVAELDKINELISLKKAQLSDLDTLAQSIFYDMFGDPIENEKGWEVKKLGEVCDVRDGTHDSPQYLSESEYFLITSKNIQGDIINYANVNYISKEDYDSINKRSYVDEGDIIMGMIGTIGKPIIVHKNNLKFCVKNVALIKFPESCLVKNIYVKALLDNDSYKQYLLSLNKGGTQKFVALGTLRTLKCPLPPLSLQQDFAKRIELIEQQKAQISSTIKDLETLLASRMQYWFD